MPFNRTLYSECSVQVRARTRWDDASLQSLCIFKQEIDYNRNGMPIATATSNKSAAQAKFCEIVVGIRVLSRNI